MATDIKELGGWEREDCEARKAGWSQLGTALPARLSGGSGGLQTDFKQERHMVRSGF